MDDQEWEVVKDAVRSVGYALCQANYGRLAGRAPNAYTPGDAVLISPSVFGEEMMKLTRTLGPELTAIVAGASHLLLE